MTDPSAFPKLVPGFEFLQNLVKNAGAALPGIGSWVAPTIDPAEIEKRIEELRTVQFWLEQNARMLGATIQALEVQRMTLSTLKTMNVQMEDLRGALQIRLPTLPTPEPEPEPAAAPQPAAARAASPPAEPTTPAPGATAPPPSAAGVVDPLQWWGALTQQFTELATNAMQKTAVEARRPVPDAPAEPGPAGAAKSRRKAAAPKDQDKAAAAPAARKKAAPRK